MRISFKKPVPMCCIRTALHSIVPGSHWLSLFSTSVSQSMVGDEMSVRRSSLFSQLPDILVPVIDSVSDSFLKAKRPDMPCLTSWTSYKKREKRFMFKTGICVACGFQRKKGKKKRFSFSFIAFDCRVMKPSLEETQHHFLSSHAHVMYSAYCILQLFSSRYSCEWSEMEQMVIILHFGFHLSFLVACQIICNLLTLFLCSDIFSMAA